ncbi:MAG: DUF2851 family protein [Chloroflexi bacterium]|nr:DUF2851 family protein [Chloroflexota bacterium]
MVLRGRRVSEGWLADIWERQAFDKRRLRTTSGVAFKVIFPGLRTGEAGPDFRDAILALPGGSLLRGDVELHLEAAGWQQHGHYHDPAYDNVVLHVLLDSGGPQALTSTGRPILSLELAGRVGPARHSPAELVPLPGPGGAIRPATNTGGSSKATLCVAESPVAVLPTPAADPQLSYVVAPCRHNLPKRTPEAREDLFRRLAVERFQAKQAVFEGELAVFDGEQALYAGLMEALGYSRNRAQFRELALAFPLTSLGLLKHAPAIEHALLAAAGLGADATALAEIGLTIPPPLQWQTLGVRPDNWPHRRIAQFAAVLDRLLPGGLVDELLAGVAEEAGPRTLRDQWRDALRELGPQRADSIAINVLLPFAAAYGQATCQFLLSETATAAFLAYPPEGANQVTRRLHQDVLGALPPPPGAAGEQALLHVWDHWCHQKVCALCPLGARLR